MVIAGSSLQDKMGMVQLLGKPFLLAENSMEVVLGMLSLILSDADIWFAGMELVCRSYMTAEGLPTTKKAGLR